MKTITIKVYGVTIDTMKEVYPIIYMIVGQINTVIHKENPYVITINVPSNLELEVKKAVKREMFNSHFPAYIEFETMSQNS